MGRRKHSAALIAGLRRGVPAGLAGAFGRLFEVVNCDLLTRDVTSPLPRASIASGASIAQLRPGDGLPRWRDAVPADRHGELAAFYQRADKGFIATVDAEFAGWIWVSRVSHRDPYSGLRIRLAADEAYAYALWVEPEFRPRGVGRALMVALLADLREDPAVTRVYGWVDRRNRQSHFLLRLLGFVDVQTVKRVHVARRIGRQLPFSDRPRFGPLSSDGRYRAAGAQLKERTP